jgi:hypothetical protein
MFLGVRAAEHVAAADERHEVVLTISSVRTELLIGARG